VGWRLQAVEHGLGHQVFKQENNEPIGKSLGEDDEDDE
jgi:hypothetical protein